MKHISLPQKSKIYIYRFLPISPTLDAKSRPCWSVSACLDMMDNRLFPWTGPVGARIRSTHADTYFKVVDFIVELPMKKKSFVITKAFIF